MLEISTLWGRNDDSLSCTTLAKRVTGKLLFATEYPGNRWLATFPVVSLEKRERNARETRTDVLYFMERFTLLGSFCYSAAILRLW